GLVKKCVIADYLAQYNNFIFNDPLAYTGFENLMGVIGFSLQIYCDFAGYSDLAIGMAALIGIQLKDNFRFPYQSLNLT
ncbi:MBOAT family protein, partial [Veillonella nakazawae]|nr:MBOAT family protein [Veillonella nakazawae]